MNQTIKIMKKTYLILFCFLITNHIFSQKIIWEYADTIPSFQHVLKKENGSYLMLGVKSITKKSTTPIKKGNSARYIGTISDNYIFELNNKNELTKKCDILGKDERGLALLPSKDEGFILIKSQTNHEEGRYEVKYFLEKYNDSFKVDWTKEIPTPGNLFNIHGHKNGAFTLAPYIITKNKEMCHFDSNGNEMWSSTIDSLTRISSVLMTSQGNFMIFGQKEIPIDDCSSDGDYLVIKLDQSGKKVWSKTYRGPGESYAQKGVETSTGDFIVGGSTYSTEGYYQYAGGVPFSGLGTKQLGILKIDKNGKLIWNKPYGVFGKEGFNNVLLTDDERIVILASTASRDGDVYKNNGANDVWLVQLDAEGELIWEETYGSDKDDLSGFIALDEENVCTIFATKEVKKEDSSWKTNKIPWVFKIDDSFDVSKPETHPTERKNRVKIMDVESIKNTEDVDNFLINQLAKRGGFFVKAGEIPLKVGRCLHALESPQWFTEDFNEDGKLDLLVYGIDEQDTYLLFWVESTTDGGYEGVSIFNSFRLDKVFTPKVITKDGKPMIVLETDKNQSPFGSYAKDDKPLVKDSLGNNNEKLKTPKLDTTKWVIIKRDIKIIQPEDDTLVYKYGTLINYNEHPREIKQIKCVEVGFRYYATSPASLKVYPNQVVEVYSAERWNEEVKLIDTFEISESEQEMIYKVAAEFKPKTGGWRTMWTHSSSVSIKVELETGEIVKHSDDLPLRSKTSNKLYQLVQPYYEKAFDSKSRR